uniref:SRCR domain-containing protein n=1 Tax=Pygocentrus nattereri TaxID=42514 RepID=A0AAR2L800_PYGNA
MEFQPPAAALTAVILMIICSTAEPDDVRLVGGSGRCDGAVEVFYNGHWRTVSGDGWTRRDAAVVCRQLDCGSAVTATQRQFEREEHGFFVDCKGSESALSECRFMGVIGSLPHAVSACLDSVRLVDGAGLCSGRVEVKSHQSWTTVCETGFDWQDAEVVCRELDCGTPLSLQGALFGEGKLPFGTKEFLCKGTENHLLNCSTSAREENTCTGSKAVGLTCSGPDDVRLVEGGSRCAGTVEMFYSGEWRKVNGLYWSMNKTDLVCRQLGCGSAAADKNREPEKNLPEWDPLPECVGSETALRECSIGLISYPRHRVSVICSDSLSSTIINIKLLVLFVMLFLMLIICMSIFLIFKTRGYSFTRNTSGAVQKTGSLQSREEEQQNVHRGAGEKLPVDLEQVVNEKQDRN